VFRITKVRVSSLGMPKAQLATGGVSRLAWNCQCVPATNGYRIMYGDETGAARAARTAPGHADGSRCAWHMRTCQAVKARSPATEKKVSVSKVPYTILASFV
jgi:hypothetical protein